MRAFKSLLVLAGFACGVVSTPAAATLDFDGLSSGSFTGPVTEDGFTYSRHSGSLNASETAGNPAPELAATVGQAGGTLSIVAEFGDAFTFVGMDIAEFDNNNVGLSTITAEGFFGGMSVGTEMFMPTPSSGLGSFTTVGPAGSLLRASLDELRILLPAEGSNPFLSYGRLDNVVLVPAPPAFVLLGLGLAFLRTVRRRLRELPTA